MEAKSLGDLLRRSCRQYPDKAAMLCPDKQEFKPITYGQLETRVKQVAGALRSLGLKRGDRACIQGENSAEWAITDWACQSLGVALVPIYPTLPHDQSQYIVQDCGAQVVFASNPEQAAKTKDLPGVRSVLIDDGPESLMKIAERPGMGMPTEEWEKEIDAAKPEDLATIIYTSGTTGPPKGAMLAHRAFTFICEQAFTAYPFSHEDTFLSFLPLSHVYERVAGHTLPISCGATVAYSKGLITLAKEVVHVKPTIMLCVPRFLEATMDKILDSTKKMSSFQQRMFDLARVELGKRVKGHFSLLAPLLDAMVGKKVRDSLGGRIRFFVSGGAALAPHVADFYRSFGLNVIQGYGLTETAAATCLNHPEPGRNKPWTVGPPLPGVDVKLADDGEILVGGPSRMIAYWNLPEATEEAIDSEGWFHTGDVGEFEDGYLKITDRKKDILVLVNGKKVAPQPIENILKESPYISEAVLFGDHSEYVYGLILPNWEHIKHELHEDAAPEVLAENPRLRELIKSEVDKVNKTMADFQKIKKHVILAGTFSIESGELTPSLKVKRKIVKEKYGEVLKTLERA